MRVQDRRCLPAHLICVYCCSGLGWDTSEHISRSCITQRPADLLHKHGTNCATSYAMHNAFPSEVHPLSVWNGVCHMSNPARYQLLSNKDPCTACLCRGSDARVHWWYWPDSYDSWIPADQAPDVDDPDKPARGKINSSYVSFIHTAQQVLASPQRPCKAPRMCDTLSLYHVICHQLWPFRTGPRKVYIRWLLDSKKFNEWMNPVDYETEEYQAEQEALDQNQSAAPRSWQADGTDAAGGSGTKRKFSPGGEAGARRAAPRQRVDPGTLFTKLDSNKGSGQPLYTRSAASCCCVKSCH